jgi:CRISPR associated protein Cas1
LGGVSLFPWRIFGTRKSPITGSRRLAVNPANAMLNCMYALLESEARLVAAALGLDPGIGFLHVDSDAREQRNGSCRLMASFASRLSESSPAWRQIIAPTAEWVSRILWTTFKHSRKSAPTHLTQSRRRYTKGTPHLVVTTPPKPPDLCRTCGRPANSGYERCGKCRIAFNTEVLIKAAKTRRLLSHSPKATAKRIAGRKRHVTVTSLFPDRGCNSCTETY